MKTFVPVIAFEPIPDSGAFLTSHRRLSFQLLGCLLQITVTQKSYVYVVKHLQSDKWVFGAVGQEDSKDNFLSHDSSELQIFLLGSTFKPLNPVKRTEKNKKRSRRTTIMGIPNQVQKELGRFTPLS